MWTVSNTRWAHVVCLCTWLMTPVAAGHGVGVLGMVVTSPHWPWVGISAVISVALFFASFWKKRNVLPGLAGGVLALGLLFSLAEGVSAAWCFLIPFALSLIGLFAVAYRAKGGA